MTTKKNIFAIIGSASKNSSNLKLVSSIRKLTEEDFDMIIFEGLSELPPFNPEQSIENTPQSILDFRAAVLNAECRGIRGLYFQNAFTVASSSSRRASPFPLNSMASS